MSSLYDGDGNFDGDGAGAGNGDGGGDGDLHCAPVCEKTFSGVMLLFLSKKSKLPGKSRS
jgi:hypothetical protein